MASGSAFLAPHEPHAPLEPLELLFSVALALSLFVVPVRQSSRAALGAPDVVAPGVELYRLSDSSLLDPVAPIEIALLRLDPARVMLSSALTSGETTAVERVDVAAERHHAIAAINAGLFRANGDPAGLLAIGGELLSEAAVPRGAVVIHAPARGVTSVEFDRVSVRADLRFVAGGKARLVPIDGVDTTRARGKLMLYTPAYHADTDTAPTGTEWVASGRPLRIRDIRAAAGRTPIPRDGVVLSFGGTALPDPLKALAVGTPIAIDRHWTTKFGVTAARLDDADAVVGGAGLLRLNGRAIGDWHDEAIGAASFITAREPRTFIGVDRRGFIWLGAVDGRSPASAGMTFAELETLCDRLDLLSALNLDGGDSTTLVVKGQVVNHPSGGAARPVSDTILVNLR